jgi:RNA recognition motif-containing protein
MARWGDDFQDADGGDEDVSKLPTRVRSAKVDKQYIKGTRVFVSGFPYEANWQDLKDYFKEAGEVLYAHVFTDSNGDSRGMGIVELKEKEDAGYVIVCTSMACVNTYIE